MEKYSSLLAPGNIGGLKIPNRVFMPAMGTGLSNYGGEVTPEILAYYRARAMSRPGVIVVEIACVDAPRGKASLQQLRIDHPRFIPGMNRLAETIKAGGSRAFIQLHHAGRQTSLGVTEGKTPLAPSAIPCKLMRTMPEEASIDDIHAVQKKFVKAAAMAQTAGFDGVELHAAHGYLLSEFISPYSNKREDEYGGTTEGRVRIIMEIIRQIKKTCPGLAVGVRASITDFIAGGLETDEGVKIAILLEEAGTDYISVSNGQYESGHTTIEPASFDEGWRVYLAEMVKARVSVPVVTGGVIRDPDFADQIIKDGKADYVFVGRNMIADPEWMLKVRQGRPEDIRPCLSCNTCIGRTMLGLAIGCAVNPYAGRETMLKPIPAADKSQKVLVVGGGPAGMAAATMLSKAGHKVSLVESGPSLGGMLGAAAKPPHKQRVGLLKDYLIRELGKTEVDVKIDTTADEKLIRDMKPDAAVIASGSVPISIPGLPEDGTVMQAVEVLNRDVPPAGQKILVVGGGTTGCETALYLANHGNQVTLIEAAGQLALGMENMSRLALLMEMKQARVKTLTKTSFKSFDSQTAQVQGPEGTAALEADQVVLALGFRPDESVLKTLGELVPEIHVIGDAEKPRNIESALYEAEMAAHII